MLFYKHMLQEQLLDGTAGGGAGATPSDASAGGTPPPAAAQPYTVDWGKFVETLPEDLRKDSSLASIKDPVSLVKSYVSAQKMVGKDKIIIPDAKHATEQDWLNIFHKLGAPQKVEEYNFKMPDGAEKIDTEFLGKLKSAAVQAGVLPHQFEKIFGAYFGYAKEKSEASETEYKTQLASDVDSLKKEWGQAFESQVKRANVALREFVPNEADRMRLIEDGLGSHPVLMKALANAAKLLKEDQFLGHGDGASAGITPEDAVKRANKLMADPIYRNPSHPSHKDMKKEVSDLFKIAYPE